MPRNNRSYGRGEKATRATDRGSVHHGASPSEGSVFPVVAIGSSAGSEIAWRVEGDQADRKDPTTAGEDLQSRNEHLVALNNQLREVLEIQRASLDDLQNVLHSTDIATLVVDTDLNLRFFTPAAEAIFDRPPGEDGGPVADLGALEGVGVALLTDMREVLKKQVPMERETKARNGNWYVRRISPCRTKDGRVAGIVVTYSDITERRQIMKALEAAKYQAELASMAKSRFLAAAIHDLRQPLQSLALLQWMLAKAAQGDPGTKLLARFDKILAGVTRMLDTLLDNQIEAGTVHAGIVEFRIDKLFEQLRDEFVPQAQPRGIDLRVVPCSVTIQSDPRLLEQLIRNLLSNALKYSGRGKVLLGCRRLGATLRIELRDTGDGISAEELQAEFDQFHRAEAGVREQGRGPGIGLVALVRRLGLLLGHRVHVRSRPGGGSVFRIHVPCLPSGRVPEVEAGGRAISDVVAEGSRRTGAILIVEGDLDLCDLLETYLEHEGHRVVTAPDGNAALETLTRTGFVPDLVLADYDLPKGMDGLQVLAAVRKTLDRDVPGAVLTGEISVETLHEIALQRCVRFVKPVRLPELTRVIERLLTRPHDRSPAREAPPSPHVEGSIIVVDDDDEVRQGIRDVFEDAGQVVEDYASAEAFLESYSADHGGCCLLIDVRLPGMNGVELLQRLAEGGSRPPAIMFTGYGDVGMAVRAMKAGAADFVEKPIGPEELLACVARALDQSRDVSKQSAWRADAAERLARLTPRQSEILTLVLDGQPNKNIAADLGISQRTVETHRAAIMKKTGVASLPALARLAFAAATGEADVDPC